MSAAPQWLFAREVLGWTLDRDVVRQLPPAHRLWARYCALYLRLRPTARVVKGAHAGLALIRRASRGGSRGYATVRLRDRPICLDITDARYLQAIAEARGEGLTAVLPRLLGPGDTFVDVGANQGGFSVVASSLVGPSGRVIAVEPQPRLARALRESLSRGPAPATVHEAAAGEGGRTGVMYVPRAYSGMASLWAPFSPKTTSLRVEVRPLDELVAPPLPGRVVLKLDAEGSELACLRGARSLLDRHRPTLLLEVNPRTLAAAGVTPEQVGAELSARGYRTFVIAGGPDEALPVESLGSIRRQCDIIARPG